MTIDPQEPQSPVEEPTRGSNGNINFKTQEQRFADLEDTLNGILWELNSLLKEDEDESQA